jgi:hypothetical protein
MEGILIFGVWGIIGSLLSLVSEFDLRISTWIGGLTKDLGLLETLMHMSFIALSS